MALLSCGCRDRPANLDNVAAAVSDGLCNERNRMAIVLGLLLLHNDSYSGVLPDEARLVDCQIWLIGRLSHLSILIDKHFKVAS